MSSAADVSAVSETVTVRGRQVGLRHVAADGEPAGTGVFLHGLGGGAATWDDLMHQLPGMECYAPDLPGFGVSDPPADDSGYTVAGQAGTLAELVRELSPEPVHLLGNSLGAAIALRLAADYPARVRSLTLISPTLPSARPRWALLALLGPLIPGIGTVLLRAQAGPDADQLARQMLEGLVGDPACLQPHHIEAAATEMRAVTEHAHAGHAYLSALRGGVGAYLRRGQGGLWAAAHRVTVPTLAVYGGADPFLRPSMAARTARALTGSRVLVLAGIGHLAHLEAPRLLAHTLQPQLATHR